MKPNALRFGAVGTVPLISAGKRNPGGRSDSLAINSRRIAFLGSELHPSVFES